MLLTLRADKPLHTVDNDAKSVNFEVMTSQLMSNCFDPKHQQHHFASCEICNNSDARLCIVKG